MWPPQLHQAAGTRQAGSKVVMFCTQHMMGRMVGVYCERCGHAVIRIKHPSYIMAGSKMAEVCAEHKSEGIVNVVSKT